MSATAPLLERIPPVRRAMLLMAGFSILWVVLEAVVGAQLKGNYNLMQVVWSRVGVHLVTLAMLFGWRQPSRLWRTRRPVFQLVRSLLMFVMPFSFALSLGLGLHADTVWAVFWIAPLLVIATAHVMIGERAPLLVWGLAASGTLAAAVVHPPTRPSSPLLLVLPIAMALSFSVYVVMTRRLRDEPVLANLFYTALGVFLVLTPMMPHVWITPTAHDLVVMIGIGTIGLLALYALDRAAAGAPVSLTASALYFYIPCLQLVLVLLHAGDTSRRALAGCAAIVVIVAFLWSWSSRAPASAALTENPVR